MSAGLLELILLWTLGTGTSIGSQLGATSVVSSQPALWMTTSVWRRTFSARLVWMTLTGPHTTPLGGPVGIIKKVPAAPPSTAPPP